MVVEPPADVCESFCNRRNKWTRRYREMMCLTLSNHLMELILTSIAVFLADVCAMVSAVCSFWRGHHRVCHVHQGGRRQIYGRYVEPCYALWSWLGIQIFILHHLTMLAQKTTATLQCAYVKTVKTTPYYHIQYVIYVSIYVGSIHSFGLCRHLLRS